MLDLRQMRQFIAVAETMSFRRAAERLHMAQPPLTATIRQMEEELGVILFERSNRITRITEAGKVLLEEARRTLAQAERAAVLARRAGTGAIGSLRIGLVASAVRQVVPPIVRRFRASHPEVSVDLQEATTAQQLEALREDRLDLGIVVLPLPIGREKGIEARTILRRHLVAVLPAGHRLSKNSDQRLRLAALAWEDWVLFPSHLGPGLHDRIVAACAQVGFAPTVTQRAVQMETIIGLVAAGIGVSLVPETFAGDRRQGVTFRRLAGPATPIRYEIALIWRKADPSPALAAFIATAIAAERAHK